MARFEVKVVSMAMSEVTDTETGKTYRCKNVWYSRGDKKKFYVNVEAVQGKQMKSMYSFPWSATILDDGRLKGQSPVGMTDYTDLAGKTSQAMPTIDLFI